MEREERNKGITEALGQFRTEGTVREYCVFGSGHINDTYLLTCELEDGGKKKYILQRMNKEVFTNPEELMENVMGVTSFLRKKILENGGDPERETLNIVPTKAGGSYFVDSREEYWRVYQFIENAVSYDAVEKPDDFYQSAVSFGNFQHLLADYPASTLHETIRGFHDTKARFATFQKAVAADVMGRAASVQKEIQFVLDHEEVANVLGDMLEAGELPLRVTHNDTKLNNIMIDPQTGKGICVIDLDTVMPGLAANDFGDTVRFGANDCREDEQDQSRVHFLLPLYQVCVQGFLSQAGPALTEQEILTLPWGARLMTLECGIRFLTDYLQGDTYFKIEREQHNLDRARTQFTLVEQMEQQWQQMLACSEQYLNQQ